MSRGHAVTTGTDRPPCLLLGQRYAGHAARSGYARLAQFLSDRDAILVDQRVSSSLPARGLAWLARRHSATTWLSYAGLRLEASAVARMCGTRERRLFHFLYGEAGFAWAAKWARRTGHLCAATFHAPVTIAPAIFRRPQDLNLLDGIVLVGSSQHSYFLDHVKDAGRVAVVPHGVDCEGFTPAERPRSDTFTCLAVGTYLRNFDLLGRVADGLREDAKTRLAVVAPPTAAPQMVGRRNAVVLHGLSDKELLNTYRTANLFVLAAHDVTANNALAEAMACGLPVLAEDVGSIRDYVTTENAILCPRNDAGAMVAAIRALAAHPETLRRMSEASRRRALELSWPRVAERMREVYGQFAECAAARRRRLACGTHKAATVSAEPARSA